jgi:hypothetical protein
MKALLTWPSMADDGEVSWYMVAGGNRVEVEMTIQITQLEIEVLINRRWKVANIGMLKMSFSALLPGSEA